MAETFELPAIGDTMVEGEVVEWFVAVGDEVVLDQPICSLETDKSVVEMTTPFVGVVLELGGQPGDIIAVGEPLIVIGSSDETPVAGSAEADATPAVPSETRPGSVISPVVRKLAASNNIDLSGVTGTGPGGRIVRSDVQALLESVDSEVEGEADAGTVLAMPKVRKLARERGIDLDGVAGTGPRGSIVLADLEPVESISPAAPNGGDPGGDGPDGDGDPDRGGERRERLSATRRAIAAHLTRSVQEIPQFTSMIEVDAGPSMATRSALMQRSGRKLPIDGLLMALLVPVLRNHPVMNAKLDGDDIVYFDHYDIGVAVDTPDGLMVPVVRQADGCSVTELGAEIRRLAGAARDRSLHPNELTGATCTINNVGALGVVAGTPILPLGTSTIIAFGMTRPMVQLRNGAVTEVPTMTISATFDHRLIDGGDSGRFLADLKQHLEVPALGLMAG